MRPRAVLAVVLLGCLAAAGLRASPRTASQENTPARIIVLVFDQDSMSASSLQRARSGAEAFIKSGLPEGTSVGVVAGGRLAGNRFTSNRDDLLKAVAAVRPNADALARQGDVPLDRSDERAGEIAATLDAGNRAVADAESRSRRSMATLQALAATLASIPGDKTVVWVSDTFSAPAGEREKIGGREPQVESLLAAASKASMRIVGVDARGAAGQLSRDDLWQALIAGTGGTLIGKEKNLAAALTAAQVAGLKARATPIEASLSAGPSADALAKTGATPAVASAPVEAAPAPPTTAPTTPAVASATPATVGTAPSMARAASSPATSTSSIARLGPDAASRDAALRETLPGSSTGLPPELLDQARLGWTAYQAGDTRAARSALGNPAAHPASPPWVRYVLGWAEFAEGNIDAARAQWANVRNAVPGFQRVYFDLADCSLQQQKPSDALSVLQDARKRWPASAEVLNAVGSVQTMLGRLDEALKAFEEAVEREPADSSGHFNVARTVELRYFRNPPAAGDLDWAAAEYRRVLELKGPESVDAAEGLRRTSPIDATKLNPRPPALVGSFNDATLGGFPVRLAWSPDGTYLCIGSLQIDDRGNVVSRPVRIVTVWSGGFDAAPQPPGWAERYWAWKSSLSAPWLPGLKIRSENRRSYSMYSMGAPTYVTVLSFRLGAEVVGESAPNITFAQGTSYSWSPYAMGALAFIDKRGVLIIMDTQGRKLEVKDARGTIILPAWSPDGVSIAYLEKSGRGYDLKIVDVYPK